MPISARGKGYPIPDEPEPEGYYCVRVYVPHDSLYLGAFWQSLHYLASPRAWANDNDHTALLAASVWKEAVQKSQDEDTCAEGDCGIMDIRQKPDFPCIIQKRLCCDGEWEDSIDLSLCTSDVEPYQEYPEDEVNDTLWAFKSTVEQVHQLLIDGKTPTQIKIQLAGVISMVPGIAAMIDLMAEETQSNRQTAIDNMEWQEPKDAVYCDRTECHLENFAWYTAFTQDWTACLIRNVENWAAEAAGLIADWAASFIDGAIPNGLLSLANLFPGGGEGFDFDPTLCEWSYSFDFTVSNGGWEQSERFGAEWECGVWQSGTGWVTEDKFPSSYKRRQLLIRKQFSEATVTKVTVHYSRSCGTFFGNDWMDTYRMYHSDSVLEEIPTLASECEGGTFAIEYEYTHTGTTELEVWLSSCKNQVDWDGAVTLTKIDVEGLGDNPFEV